MFLTLAMGCGRNQLDVPESLSADVGPSPRTDGGAIDRYVPEEPKVTCVSRSGELDLSFGEDGFAYAPHVEGVVSALAVDPTSGKMVVVLNEDPEHGSTVSIVRYLRTGEPDPTFGADGVTGFAALGDEINASGVAIQSDGDIIVAGTFTFLAGPIDQPIGWLMRLDPNGIIDSRLLILPVPQTSFSSVVIGAGDTIVAAGGWLDPAGGILVARYTPDVILDRTFGVDGIVRTRDHHVSARAFDVAVHTDGSIVVSGTEDTLTFPHSTLIRYDARGEPDPTFGNQGIVWGSASSARGYVGLDADNRTYSAVGWGLWRYLPNGRLDQTYGDAGRAEIPRLDGGIARALAVKPDGEAIMLGKGTDEGVGVVRVDANGYVDPMFGHEGLATVRHPSGGMEAAAVASLPDGRIVVAGTVRDPELMPAVAALCP